LGAAAAAAPWALGTQLMRRTRIAHPTLAISFWMTVATTLWMTLLAVVFERDAWTLPSAPIWGAIVYNAIGVFAFAQVVWLMLARELAGPEFNPLRLDFAYPPPAYAQRYTEVFRCEVRFEQPRNGMMVARRWLDLPFQSYNPVTSRQALAMCRAQLEAESGCGETTAAVERQLRPRLHENPQMSDVAALLHLSERTLRRQLAAEGTSFTAIHDRIRSQRVLELLHTPQLTISQIGNQVGFTDVREFRRAFKRWTGLTPSEARARMA